MSKLPSYGITARALQILLEAQKPVSQIPEKWFNWVGVAPAELTQHSAFAPQRLSIVCARRNEPNSAARWCANNMAAGYHCVFIDAVDDDHCIDELGLLGGVEYSVLAPSNDDRISNQAILAELREPDEDVTIQLDNVRQGGGAMIEKMGFADVTAAQWRVYGQFLEEWIEQTKDEKTPEIRVETPDFSKWNPWEHLGGEGRILSLSEHFNTPASTAWPWNVENPITAKQISTLGSDIEAFWPMRQMPFCGVIRTTKGVLKAVGALPNTLDASGNWLWDDGSIRAALLKAAAQRVKASAGRKASGLVEWVIELMNTSTPSMAMTAAASTVKSSITKKEIPAREIFIEWKQVKKGGQQPEGIACKLYVHQEQVLLQISITDAAAQEAMGLSFVVLTVGGMDQRYSIAPTDTPNLWRVKAISATQVSDLALTLARYASNRAKQNTILIESGLKVC